MRGKRHQLCVAASLSSWCASVPFLSASPVPTRAFRSRNANRVFEPFARGEVRTAHCEGAGPHGKSSIPSHTQIAVCNRAMFFTCKSSANARIQITQHATHACGVSEWSCARERREKEAAGARTRVSARLDWWERNACVATQSATGLSCSVSRRRTFGFPMSTDVRPGVGLVQGESRPSSDGFVCSRRRSCDGLTKTTLFLWFFLYHFFGSFIYVFGFILSLVSLTLVSLSVL